MTTTAKRLFFLSVQIQPSYLIVIPSKIYIQVVSQLKWILNSLFYNWLKLHTDSSKVSLSVFRKPCGWFHEDLTSWLKISTYKTLIAFEIQWSRCVTYGLFRATQALLKMDGASVSNKLGVEKGSGWKTFTTISSVRLLVLRKLSKVNTRYKKADAWHRLHVSCIRLSWLNESECLTRNFVSCLR